MRFVDNLFGSKTRTQVLRFFFRNSEGRFNINDIAAQLKMRPKEVEKEVKALFKLKIIKKENPSNGHT